MKMWTILFIGKRMAKRYGVNLLLSHPSWVRGLKLEWLEGWWTPYQSHPSWVRGLKLYGQEHDSHHQRRTLRGCVD